MKTNRREFLRRLATVGASASIAGCAQQSGSGRVPSVSPMPGTTTSTPPGTANGTGTGTGTPSAAARLAEEWGFEGTVDLVEAGADPTGSEPIDDLLRRTAGPDRLVYLPRGRYRLQGSVSFGGLARLGLVGNGATIVPPDGNEDTLFAFGWPEPLESALFAGISFDFSAPNTGGRPLLARADQLLVEESSVLGEADVDQDLFRVDVTDPDGLGVVRRLRLPDGAPADTKVTGCEVGSDTVGDTRFVDCRIDGFPDNGLYANPPKGSVTVLGGSYRNNGIAGVRVEADADSVVRDVHVRCDEATGSGQNMRGIRLRAGNSILVENCLVEMLEVTSSDGGIVLSSQLGSATIRDCTVRVDADGVNAIRIKSARRDDQEGEFRCENLTIVGSAAEGAAIRAANRSGCSFRNVCLYQPGPDRDGVSFDDVSGEIVDSTIAVTGEPFVFERSSVARRNVRVASSDDVGSGAHGPCAPTAESRDAG